MNDNATATTTVKTTTVKTVATATTGALPALVQSPVAFDAGAHTYTAPDGTPLGGVTPIVSWMFPETYGDVPEAVMRRAAEQGKAVHEQCQMADNLGVVPEDALPQTLAYLELCRAGGLVALANEYLVADMSAGIASSVDMVTEGLDLCDIKTTSRLHTEMVTLQLSIYAWLFEAQNPGLRAGRLIALWVPNGRYGAPEARVLRRLPADGCRAAVEAFLRREDAAPHRERLFPDYMPAPEAETLPATLSDVEDKLLGVERDLRRLKALKEELTAGLTRLMEDSGVKKWQSERLTLTYVPATSRTTLDAARLKKEAPEVWAAYARESAAKAGVRITERKQKQTA
jgi:hypothetical protein